VTPLIIIAAHGYMKTWSSLKTKKTFDGSLIH